MNKPGPWPKAPPPPKPPELPDPPELTSLQEGGAPVLKAVLAALVVAIVILKLMEAFSQ